MTDEQFDTAATRCGQVKTRALWRDAKPVPPWDFRKDKAATR